MIVLELLFDLSTGGPHMTLLEALLFVSVNVKIAAHGPSWYAAAAKTKSLEDNEYTKQRDTTNNRRAHNSPPIHFQQKELLRKMTQVTH